MVENGLCIGCGLCESVSGGRVKMQMTSGGSLRPQTTDAFSAAEEKTLLAGCPGAAVTAPRREEGEERAAQFDEVWGGYDSMRYAWAADAEVRFRAATGGALTALGAHLLTSGKIAFVLQVKADANAPMRNTWTLSESPAQVISAAGSRYSPAAVLAGLHTALARRQPFAIIAKPCDISAVHNLAAVEPRVDEFCRWRLCLVCGGQSRLGKSQALLAEVGVEEKEVTVFRYRGYGNPGRTRVETADGRAFEKTYHEMWEDAAGWQIETRCKFCADALGECADVAAADVWENAVPAGEDAGINGIIARTAKGQALVEGSAAAGALTLGEAISARQFDHFQPHQVQKKIALAARFEGLAAAGMPPPAATGLRVDTLGKRLDTHAYAAEKEGTIKRAQSGRFSETLP